MWLLYYFSFERNYDVLKSKGPCILLDKNINFNKNETESKMERDKPCSIFCTAYFVKREFFLNISLYLFNSHNIHTFTYQKNITSYTFLLAFKIAENLQCIRNKFWMLIERCKKPSRSRLYFFPRSYRIFCFKKYSSLKSWHYWILVTSIKYHHSSIYSEKQKKREIYKSMKPLRKKYLRHYGASNITTFFSQTYPQQNLRK